MKVVKWVVIGFVLLIFVSCIARMGGSGKTSGNVVTMEKFSKIENGMSYEAVVGIIGKEGELNSQNQIQGGGVVPTIDTAMYSWTNPSGTGMNAIFQNDKLMQKSQFGLK